MSEDSEMLMLLKELVSKVKHLEEAVYHKDNLLMKSGLVVVDSPSPRMDSNNIPMDNTIRKNMDWEDIHELVTTMENLDTSGLDPSVQKFLRAIRDRNCTLFEVDENVLSWLRKNNASRRYRVQPPLW